MKKISQRELLQEDFADMVRAAGRVAADIYAPVIKPIKDALNAWESPEKALREYVKKTPNIRIIEILGKPVKVGDKAKWSPGSGKYGTNIYQIRFNAEVYKEKQGKFNPNSSAAAPAAPSVDYSTDGGATWAAASPPETPETPETLRADIERIEGKYRVLGIYDSKGESLGLKSTPTKTSPVELVKDLFDGDPVYTFKLISVLDQNINGNQTNVKFEAYHDPGGRFSSVTQKGDYVAIVAANNKSIVKVYKASDTGKDPIPFTTT